MHPQETHNRPGRAWTLLWLALALHVFDEAMTDFLSVYNPTVRAIRENVPWLPMPAFTFETWIVGLAVAIAALAALTRFVGQRRAWMRVLGLIIATAMTVNALGHATVSAVQGRMMPGTLSAPVLLAAALYVVWSFHDSHRWSRSSRGCCQTT